MPSQRDSVRFIANAILSGELEEDGCVKRIGSLIDGPRPHWVRPLSRRIVTAFAGMRPTRREIMEQISRDRSFCSAWGKKKISVRPTAVLPAMNPKPGAPESWDVPRIDTLPDLATKLSLHPDDLGWLTLPGAGRHYHYEWQKKRSSGSHRLIEIPKPLLKLAQRAVLERILDHIPPHEASHGFRKGCSIGSFVEGHTGRDMVLRMDLRDFFPSIFRARVLRLFLTAGYPEEVALSLARLCTQRVPPEVVNSAPGRTLTWLQRQRFQLAHLPQGTPTAPALANLCAFRLDCRLSGLARKLDVHYTRYADDLLFSGDGEFARRVHWFGEQVNVIVLEEGFQPHTRKMRVMRRSQRQRAAGVILNEKPNLDRREFDRLKAVLTNCVRHGPQSQNRDGHEDFRAHLRGRIGWVRFLNPARGEKLEQVFRRIAW